MNEVKVALKVIVKYTGVIYLRLCVYGTWHNPGKRGLEGNPLYV